MTATTSLPGSTPRPGTTTASRISWVTLCDRRLSNLVLVTRLPKEQLQQGELEKGGTRNAHKLNFLQDEAHERRGLVDIEEDLVCRQAESGVACGGDWVGNEHR